MKVKYTCKEDGVFPEGVTSDSLLKVEVNTAGMLIDATEDFKEPKNGVDYVFTVDPDKA